MSNPGQFSFALATLLFATGAGGAPPAVNPYRLQLSGQGEYRLVAAPPTHTPGPSAAALARKPYAHEIDQAARRNQLDPALVHAVIHVESRHQAAAVSSKGAVGLMQVLPATAERFGISDPGDPVANVSAGTRYLRRLLDQFDQRLDLALAAYNAGEGAVIRYGNRIPPYRETRDYVPSVMEKYREWLGIQPSPVTYLPGTRLDARAIAALPAD